MTQPLALVLYEKLMPGSQLVNRLQDLHYRVQPLTEAAQLAPVATSEGPMLIAADLESSRADICGLIAGLKRNPATAHIPILAFGDEANEAMRAAASAAGATLVVNDTALLAHLPQWLEQVLRVE